MRSDLTGAAEPPHSIPRRPWAALALMLAVGLLALPGWAEEAEPPKTLAECEAIALTQHPSIGAADSAVAAGAARVRAAAAGYLPQVSAIYSANRRETSATARGDATVGQKKTFNFYNTGVSFSQVLFDFGQSLHAIRAARASVESLEAEEDVQRETVLRNVRQAYFDLLAARRLLGVAEETRHQNEQHLEQARGRYEVGLAPKFDVTQAQVQLANAELNLVTARNNVSLARETLRNALGLTGPLAFDIVDTLDLHEREVSESEALAQAYDKRPELRSLRAQELAGNEQVAALQANYLPNISGVGNYNWTGTDYPLQPNWNIGANVNLSLFNGGLTTAQIAEARANLSTLKFNEQVLRQNIALEVRQAVLNLQQAAESVRVSAKGLGLARENLDLAEGRYQTGVGNIIELTDAQASLTSAEANHVQALYGYQTSIAALEKATAQSWTE